MSVFVCTHACLHLHTSLHDYKSAVIHRAVQGKSVLGIKTLYMEHLKCACVCVFVFVPARTPKHVITICLPSLASDKEPK